jgi:hypothetical protein
MVGDATCDDGIGFLSWRGRAGSSVMNAAVTVTVSSIYEVIRKRGIATKRYDDDRFVRFLFHILLAGALKMSVENDKCALDVFTIIIMDTNIHSSYC